MRDLSDSSVGSRHKSAPANNFGTTGCAPERSCRWCGAAGDRAPQTIDGPRLKRYSSGRSRTHIPPTAFPLSLLQHVTPAEKKRLGAFYTPDDVAQALVGWVVRRAADRMLDPACGDGRFLAAHEHCYGVDRDRGAISDSLRRAPWATTHHGDFFQWAGATSERFDCAAGNPPFIRYQSFSGEVRNRALNLCRRIGVVFSGLTSSWAPFLAVSASLLKPGGRMAFVVPAEIGHAPYAEPLLAFLAAEFDKVQLLAIEAKLFPELSEDVWLLYAEGFGGSTPEFLLTECRNFERSALPPQAGTAVSLADWQRWNRRLRPFLLPADVRDLYRRLASAPGSVALQAVARVGVGYVTGANDFFHLRPSIAKFLGIPQRYLLPSVRNARALPEHTVTHATVEAWMTSDCPSFLLRLSRGDPIPPAIQQYLNSSAARAARDSYKCSNRNPWYVVPDVHVPDAFLSYMSGQGPNLVANAAGCVCTNSVHSVRLKDGWKLPELVRRWRGPATPLSCEIEGHPLGGGMLKLEPGEAARIVLAAPDAPLSSSDDRLLADGVQTLRRWRHYGAPALASSTRRLEWSKSPALDEICAAIDLSARLAAN